MCFILNRYTQWEGKSQAEEAETAGPGNQVETHDKSVRINAVLGALYGLVHKVWLMQEGRVIRLAGTVRGPVVAGETGSTHYKG